jgi:hypothetical protein
MQPAWRSIRKIVDKNDRTDVRQCAASAPATLKTAQENLDPVCLS